MAQPHLPHQDDPAVAVEMTEKQFRETVARFGPGQSGYSAVAGEYTGDNLDGVHIKYERVSGTRVMRPMGMGAGRTVRLHADFWRKVVQFTYERLGDWPKCPSPFGRPANEHLSLAELTCPTPLQMPQGRAFRVSGIYYFALLDGLAGNGRDAWGPFPLATSPESIASLDDNTVPFEIFDPSALGVGFHKLA